MSSKPSMSAMPWPSVTPPDSRDQAEYLGILGLAPAEDVKAFVEALTPELGPVDVVSVQTGLLRFEADAMDRCAPDGATPLPVDDVLVTEAHVLLSDVADGYSAVIGSNADHAIAAAILDAAWHVEPSTDAFRAIQRRIQAFIDTQAAILAGDDDAADRRAGEQAFSQADLLPA